MPTVYDVPADELIKRTAQYLHDNFGDINPPSWAIYVKTGSYLDKPPQDPDFWYIRSASLLRKIYVNRVIGVDHLKKEYGGRTRKGTVGKHKKSGGGTIIRNILKQLEKVGLVETINRQGRKVTQKGTSILDSLAGEVLKNLEKETPGLEKYR